MKSLHIAPRWAVALLLAASLAVNVVQYQYGARFFTQLNAVRLDPLGLDSYRGSEPPPRASQAQRVVLLGDSRALMWTTPDATALPSVQFVNRGIGFQTTEQVVRRFEHDIPQLKPDVVLLQLGVNDLKCIALFPERKPEIVEKTKRNIQALVALSRAAGATVVLTPVFPLGPLPLHRRPFWSPHVAASIVEVNRFLETLATAHVFWLPVADVLTDGDGQVRDAYALDLLHLTPAAYDALNTRRLLPLLRQLQSQRER